MKPVMPTAAKAAGQPSFEMMYTTMGGARMAPTAEPLLNMPEARARSRSGNHSATTFTPPGQLPASPMPSRKRNMPKLKVPRAKACRKAAADHHAMQRRSEEHTSELQSL